MEAYRNLNNTKDPKTLKTNVGKHVKSKFISN